MASDDDNDIMTYTAQGLPPGLFIDSQTGLISGIPDIGSAGTYSVTLTVSDNNGGIAIVTLQWNVTIVGVNSLPVITPISGQNSLESQTIALQVLANDADNDALTYSSQSLPPTLFINSQTGLISGNLEIGSSGIYAVTVSVSDGNGGVTNELFEWSVTDNSLVNGNFETDGALPPTTLITGWTVLTGDVEVIASGYNGGYALDLNGTTPGSIIQTLTDLTPNVEYMLDIVWADQLERDQSLQTLATADIFIDGQYIGSMRTTSDAFYIDCNAFPFIPTASSAELEIRSTTPSNVGLRIDNVDIRQGIPVAPPTSSLNFTNGGFETPLDPLNIDPHICGFDLPGWLVTQENVDVIALASFGAPEGNAMIDVGGHGPGGIAQTITDLIAGQTYQLSFEYARHSFWDQEPVLTAEIIIDGIVVDTLSRDQTQKAPAWEFYSLNFVAPSGGAVTIEFRSTALTVGGGVLFDDIAITVQ